MNKPCIYSIKILNISLIRKNFNLNFKLDFYNFIWFFSVILIYSFFNLLKVLIIAIFITLEYKSYLFDFYQ
jgi:hypothetical protein